MLISRWLFAIVVMNRKSPFGMPFFFGMIAYSMELHPGFPFYGYINGDILVENTLSEVLHQLHKDIQSGKISKRVSVFSHRKNMFFQFPDDLYSNHQESREHASIHIKLVIAPLL